MPKKIKEEEPKKKAKNVKKSKNEEVVDVEVNICKNGSPKKNLKKYEDKFEELKEKYISLCKSAHDIQVELNKVDMERESVLNEIRQLQVVYTPQLNAGFNIDEVVTSKENDDNITSNLIKVTSGNSLNKIKLKKKPTRSTDMETDDSDSENLSQEIDCSESDESD